MDLQGRITAYVWGKIIPKEASDCADFILEIPGIMETRQALADLVAAAPDVVEALCEATEHIDRKADNEPAGILQIDEKIYAREIKTRGDALTSAVERAQQVL